MPHVLVLAVYVWAVNLGGYLIRFTHNLIWLLTILIPYYIFAAQDSPARTKHSPAGCLRDGLTENMSVSVLKHYTGGTETVALRESASKATHNYRTQWLSNELALLLPLNLLINESPVTVTLTL